MSQMHHGDLRCIHTSAVGFVLKKYYGSVRGVTKTPEQNYNES